MRTLRSLILAQVIVTALSTPSGAAPGSRHVAEPVHKAASNDGDGGDGAGLDVDVPEVAPARPRTIAAAERDTGWHAGITAGADFPLDALHVGFAIQAPSGLRLSSSIGFLADVFLGGMDAPAGGPAATALMHAAMRDVVVWRTHLGIKPWKTHGFFASAGYSLCNFSVAMTAEEAMSALGGGMLPFSLGSTPLAHMTTTLQALDLEAGWEWPIARHFKLQTSVSAGMMIASSSTIHVDDGPAKLLTLPPVDQMIAPVERAGEAAIDAMFKQAGPIVMLTVQLQFDLL